jgi:hypothetical protein
VSVGGVLGIAGDVRSEVWSVCSECCLCWRRAGLSVDSAFLEVQSFVGGATVPRVHVWDNFDRNVSSLSGSLSASGFRWTSTTGTWASDGAVARGDLASTNDLLLQFATFDAALKVTISPGPSAAIGALLHDDGTNRILVRYESGSSGTILVEAVEGSTSKSLGAVSGVNESGATQNLEIQSNSSEIRVLLDGSLQLTVALDAEDMCTYKSQGDTCEGDGAPNIGFGIWSDRDGESSVDDFRVESLT